MKKHSIITILILIIHSTVIHGQQLEPLDLAKKIFNKEVFPNLNEFVIGEYKGEPNGQNLADGAILYFKLLGQIENTAVVNMTILDSLGKGVDTYLHFEKDIIWKMSAFRGLAMTGFIEQMVLEMEKMTQAEMDKILQKAQEAEENINLPFKTKDELELLLNNAKLTIELDDNIVQHFNIHKSEFEELKDSALSEFSKIGLSEFKTTKLLESKKSNYKKVLITSVFFGDYLVGGNCLSFSIGGMVDNTVGYLYVEDIKNLPEMNPSRLIMLREIGGGWYLYKTT